MKVCIVGLGAVGGTIAAAVAGAGVEVSALARGATLAAVREQGLRLLEGGTTTSYRLTVSDDPRDLGDPDLVVLSVKAPALPAVAPAVATLLGPDTTILSATKGVPWWFFAGLDASPELPSLHAEAMAGIPVERVVGAVVYFSAATPEPGVVAATGIGGRIVVGGATGPSERADRVGDVLRSGGFDVAVSPRIQDEVWFKLWGNMTMNPISALTGATLDRVLDDELVRAFASRCMAEAAAVGREVGLQVDSTPEERHRVTRRLGTARTSMLQDVDAGRPVEIDALVTAVVELGRAVGVRTPELDTLLGLARLHARVRGLYPDDRPA